jgi:pectate lyase
LKRFIQFHKTVMAGFAAAMCSLVVVVSATAAALPDSAYDLSGFGWETTGGGEIAETDPRYRKVSTPAEFRAAITDTKTKVIEIMNDLNLGWNELPASEQKGRFRQNTAPKLHPVLLITGVGQIDIQDFNGLTIFSANGARIRHAGFNIKRCHQFIIRNLVFDELWEWDEATKGNYDSNDWDYIAVDNGSSHVWIDHCTFGKAYDGIVEVKTGSNHVTVSWCRFLEDDGGTNSWVRQQIVALEGNAAAHPMYAFLRANRFSVDDIVAISRSQKKGHLVGATAFTPANADLSVTLHHNLYLGMQDRIPRVRGGNVHVFNIHVDNRNAHAARLRYDARVAAMSPEHAAKLSDGTYHFGVTQNGAIATEGGAVLVEKSYFEGVRNLLRNNQGDRENPAHTGKIRAVDVIFIHGKTKFRGDSETPGHPFGPVQAAVIPFAWTGFETLPYSYAPHDPEQLPAMLAAGAGATRLAWPRKNWLKTRYADAVVEKANPPVLSAPSLRR